VHRLLDIVADSSCFLRKPLPLRGGRVRVGVRGFPDAWVGRRAVTNQLDRFDPEVPTHVDGKTEAERELARQGKGVRAAVDDVVQMSLSRETVGMLTSVSKGERGLAG